MPKYKGLHPIQRAFEAGDEESGCSLHFVSNELDGGEIIAQSAVKIENTDTLELLEEKVHEAEHKLVVATLKSFSEK